MTTMAITRRQCPGRRGHISASMPTRSLNRCRRHPPSRLTRSVIKFYLTALAFTSCCCHWHLVAAAANLDEKSAAMAERIIQKVVDFDTPPPSWIMMLRVLQHSFRHVHVDDDNYFYQSPPHEEKGRQLALRWLAHDDDETLSNISEGEYDRGLLARYALATIYFSTGGDNEWGHCSRKQSTACESDEERYLSPYSHLKWTGINGKDGKLTWLDLSSRGLSSPTFLPFEANLLSPSLELLWVSENEQLAGTLPDYLGEFQNLVSLSAYKNSVSGTIPESIYGLSKLNSVRLYKSKFSGTISTQIEKLGGLKWLWIHDNDFTGEVPEVIGKLEKLEGVTLHGNQFAPIEKNKAGEGVDNDGSRSLNPSNNVVPEALCTLRENGLKHLWADCEAGSLTQSALLDNGESSDNAGDLVKKAGVQACSCCTRCFPRKDENDVLAAVN